MGVICKKPLWGAERGKDGAVASPPGFTPGWEAPGW